MFQIRYSSVSTKVLRPSQLMMNLSRFDLWAVALAVATISDGATNRTLKNHRVIHAHNLGRAFWFSSLAESANRPGLRSVLTHAPCYSVAPDVSLEDRDE